MQTLVAMKRLIVLFYNSGKLDGLTFHFSLERIVLRTSCYLARKRRDWITKLRAHVGLSKILRFPRVWNKDYGNFRIQFLRD